MNAATKRFRGLAVERLRRVDLDDPAVAHDRDRCPSVIASVWSCVT